MKLFMVTTDEGFALVRAVSSQKAAAFFPGLAAYTVEMVTENGPEEIIAQGSTPGKAEVAAAIDALNGNGNPAPKKKPAKKKAAKK